LGKVLVGDRGQVDVQHRDVGFAAIVRSARDEYLLPEPFPFWHHESQGVVRAEVVILVNKDRDPLRHVEPPPYSVQHSSRARGKTSARSTAKKHRC
jgi:hypothetical protein